MLNACPNNWQGGPQGGTAWSAELPHCYGTPSLLSAQSLQTYQREELALLCSPGNSSRPIGSMETRYI